MSRLAGRVVVVTRNGDPNDPLVVGLRAQEAEVRLWPTLAFRASDDPAALTDALRRLDRFDWIVFTSARSVDVVIAEHPEPPGPNGPAVAAVGAATAGRLREWGWSASVVGRGGAESLVEAVADARDLTGASVLFPAASRARDTLSSGLAARGARVERVEAYQTVLSPPDADAVRADLEGGVDAVTFASPSAVRALESSVGELRGALQTRPAVAIGPTTERALRERGVERVVRARDTSIQGLIQAVVHALNAPERSS